MKFTFAQSKEGFDKHIDKSSSAAPALANFALLLAEGDANKYVQVISELYRDNGIAVPDFSRYHKDPEMIDNFEDDNSFMEELEDYHQNRYSQTAFTEEYYALCSVEMRDTEDWFDLDDSDITFLDDSMAVNIPCEDSSTSILIGAILRNKNTRISNLKSIWHETYKSKNSQASTQLTSFSEIPDNSGSCRRVPCDGSVKTCYSFEKRMRTCIRKLRLSS